MQSYSNTGGNSNIIGYRSEQFDWIQVYFSDGSNYTYTADSCGESAIDEMLRLAKSGKGLNSFISRNKPAYESKS